jgi:hypothetical protein
MMKIFVSQPMRDTNKTEIMNQRKNALEELKTRIGDFELINTYFENFDGNRLQFLAKSISEGLAIADMALFIGDWEHYAGCRCEHFIAIQYTIPCMYYKEPRIATDESGSTRIGYHEQK